MPLQITANIRIQGSLRDDAEPPIPVHPSTEEAKQQLERAWRFVIRRYISTHDSGFYDIKTWQFIMQLMHDFALGDEMDQFPEF